MPKLINSISVPDKRPNPMREYEVAAFGYAMVGKNSKMVKGLFVDYYTAKRALGANTDNYYIINLRTGDKL